MRPPPSYPRMPYLVPPPGRSLGSDRVVPLAERAKWLTSPVVVEEKLDGANVSLWLDDSGRVRAAPRGGPDARDRARQLGRLRAWAAEMDEALRRLLAEDTAIYGEWLWLTHGTHYDLLPNWLVVLDLWTPSEGLLDNDERDNRVGESALPLPPRRFSGVLGSIDYVHRLLGRSAFSSTSRAEGLVLRATGGRRCKVVDVGYVRRTDEQWVMRQHNEVASEPVRSGQLRGSVLDAPVSQSGGAGLPGAATRGPRF